MLRFSRPALTCVLLSFLALAATSCSRQAGKERSLARADAYYSAGELDKAEIEYLNTLKTDPENHRSFGQLGLIYAEQGRIGKAPAFLYKARTLQPENLEVRTQLAVFYLAAKKMEDARTELRYVLEHQPSHAEAALLLAECVQQPKDVAEVRAFLKNLSTAGSAPVIVALASLEFRERKLPEAETMLKQALALDPKSAATYSSLGTVYLTQNNLKGAEDAFAASWKHAAIRSTRKLSYVRFKIQTGDTAGARQLLTELTTQAPDSLPALMLLAELGVRDKKLEESIALTDKILARDPFHYPAMMLSARLHLAKSDPDKALVVLERLKSLQPKNPEVAYQFALTYLAKGDTAKAAVSLNQAVDLAPGYVDAILQLADLNLRKGDAKAASVALAPVVAQHPKLAPAKFLLAKAYAAQGNFEDAIANYRDVAASSPKEPSLLLPIALIYRQQRKPAEAREILTKVLELEPNSEPAIEQMVDLELISGNTAAARQRASALKSRQPDKAGAYLLLAKVCLVEKNFPEAEAELLKAVELQPDASAAYYMLAGIYGAIHQEKKALDQLVQISLKTPKNPALFMRIALLHEQLKDYAAARTAYEKVLALDPKFLPALNNLAYLRAERFNELEGGLELAKKARDLGPLEPNIADTLGWILYKQGQFQQARTLLLESAAKSPDDSVVQFHLGMAHYMMGDTESARTILQRALQLNPTHPDKTQINQRLAILGSDEATSGAGLRELMEKAVAENKNDPVALTRLGVILEKSGELDRAQTALNAALAVNPLNVSAALALIRVHLARHDTNQAMELAKSTRKRFPEDSTVGYQLGKIAFQTGDYQWAASLLQESARKSPDDLDVLFDQAKSAYSIGRVDSAEESFRHIQKASPLHQGASEISRYLEMMTLATQPSPEGVAKIDQALKADPAFVPALMAQGVSAEKRSDATTARESYEKALAKYPDFTPAKRSLTLLASTAKVSEPKAYDLAIQAREAFPSDPEVAQALGIITYRKGDFGRAATLLKESIARLGEDPQRTFYLGMAQFRGKDSAARSTLQRSLELGLRDDFAAEARRTIAEIK